MKNNKKQKASPCSDKQNPKTPYRIRNWKDYNTSLVRRGSITVWFEESAQQRWLTPERTGKPGASPHYSDLAIACVLTLGLVFHLPLRQQQGFTESVIRLLGVDLPVPDYTTLCRRRKTLSVNVPASCSKGRAAAIHVVVDSTGLKIYGEGEWKVRLHGVGKRRTWRKLHLAVDEASGEIRAAQLTEASTGDGEQLPSLLSQVEEEGGVTIRQVSADGAYDSWACHEAIQKREAKATIPPRLGSKIKQHGNSKKPPLSRDENLRRIRKIGESAWKKESGYHRRSLAETAMYRQKQIFGAMLRGRLMTSQTAEAKLRCVALNRMTALGMPDSYAVLSPKLNVYLNET